MITPTKDLIEAVLFDLRDVMDYVASESGDDNINRWLSDIERKLEIVQKRFTNPVVPQEGN